MLETLTSKLLVHFKKRVATGPVPMLVYTPQDVYRIMKRRIGSHYMYPHKAQKRQPNYDASVILHWLKK